MTGENLYEKSELHVLLIVKDVFEFMRRFNCPVGTEPGIPPIECVELATKLVTEEFDELMHAVSSNDNLEAIADSIVDLIYVLVYMSLVYGINISEVWHAVHSANMRKSLDDRNAYGKVMKPVGWTAPNVKDAITDGQHFLEAAKLKNYIKPRWVRTTTPK